MFYGRLQTQRATLAVPVLFTLVGALGLAAAANPSFPREQESTSRVDLGKVGADWIPAFAGMTGVGAGQTPASAPPSTNAVNAQTPPPSTKDIRNQPPLGMSGKSSREVPPKAVGVGAESRKTTTPRNLPVASGRRDPFRAWVTPTPASHSPLESGALPAGTRGLVISSLQLEGVVRQQPADTMIAVVTNYTKRAYFLRVNDTVYNGVVSKITPVAIYFKENALDSQGRAATREVEIKLGSAPGEGR